MGFCFLTALGESLGLDMPVAAGLLALGSVVAGIDFHSTGRTWQSCGLAELDKEVLRDFLIQGRGLKVSTQGLSVAAYGAGRMGCGIGICFALVGWQINLIDSKSRDNWPGYKAGIEAEIALTLALLVDLDCLPAGSETVISKRITLHPYKEGLSSLSNTDVVFEAVPETEVAKKEAFRKLESVLPHQAIVAPTTLTFLADLLAEWSTRPEYVLNAHFLNPAFLMPLVEVSPHEDTNSSETNAVKEVLEEIGKVPVLCKKP